MILLYQLSLEIILFIINPTESQIPPPHNCANFGLCNTNYGDPNDTSIMCAAADCVCPAGTTGFGCVSIIDQCALDPCANPNFVCTGGINTRTCDCDPGWTGADCEIGLDSVCATVPCANGGICDSEDNVQYTCNCSTTGGYLEPNCLHKDPCFGTPCKNGATCQTLYNGVGYTCDCKYGFVGQNCEDTSLAYEQIYMGCYDYSSTLEDPTKYLKINDNKMSVTMCKGLLEAYVPPKYTMYTVYGKNCYLSTASTLNATSVCMPPDCVDTFSEKNCFWQCKGNGSELCGDNTRVHWYLDNTTSSETNQCTNDTTLCSAGISGTCIDLKDAKYPAGYKCVCEPAFTGPDCDIPVPGACASVVCQNNGTCENYQQTYKCICEEGYVGNLCQYAETCVNGVTCLYGGTCVENTSGGAPTCNCIENYSGTHCENIDICKYANPCLNGSTCTNFGNGVEIDYKCNCKFGFTGINCDMAINFCEPINPCNYSGICTPIFGDVSCACVVGTSGPKCEINLPDCLPVFDSGSPPIKIAENGCQTKDKNAVCIDGINGYTCNCSDAYVLDRCNLSIVIRDVLEAIYGDVNLEMIPILEDLMSNPTKIKDLIPFIIGTLDLTNRTALSWSYDDLFMWAAFEEKELILERDMVCWNDVVLGNCFSFNHYETNSTYLMRTSGKEGGFETLMRAGQSEYVPWTDTAAILVFLHNKNEYVFSESVRYNAQPNGEMNLYVIDTRYTRLDGKYGVCVNEPSDVQAYYYSGMYTTDGCLRSCYQDLIQSSCGCMDPRYPMPTAAISCGTTKMTCIDTATAAAGDPSTWDSCVCPLPCNNQQYSVQWTRADNVNMPTECTNNTGAFNSSCEADYQDNVLISIRLPTLDYSTYKETPLWDLNRFISNLGGLLGVLMGVSIFSFLEIVFLLVKCCTIMIAGKKV